MFFGFWMFSSFCLFIVALGLPALRLVVVELI